MASLLLPDDDPNTPAPLLQLPDERPPSLQPDPRADALGQTYKDITDYMAQRHQKGVDEGYWTGGGLLEGGHPTLKAFNSAADEYAQGLLMGSTSSSGKYLKAYHGSPHKFDAFDDKAIGTGEGAQAYGYGHYLAENEGVARGYRDALSPKPSGPAVDAYNAANDAFKAKVADLSQARRSGAPVPPEMLSEISALQKQMTEARAAVPPSGHMYEVNVAADPEKFLHWDKPLSEQHPAVRDQLSEIISGQQVPRKNNVGAETTGGQLVQYLEQKYGDKKSVAEDLKFVGIPGIRYLDRGSRQIPYQIAQSKQAIVERQNQIAEIQADIARNQNNPGLLPRYFTARQEEIAQHQQVIDQINERMSEGTHNAVIFDPANMEIIRRYGLAGLMLGGGGLLSPDKQEQ